MVIVMSSSHCHIAGHRQRRRLAIDDFGTGYSSLAYSSPSRWAP
jgi:sensor c-di-GMP phosphodiesterase-like protein